MILSSTPYTFTDSSRMERAARRGRDSFTSQRSVTNRGANNTTITQVILGENRGSKRLADEIPYQAIRRPPNTQKMTSTEITSIEALMDSPSNNAANSMLKNGCSSCN